MSIRNRTLLIPYDVYAALKIVAEIQQIDCAETVAELWLRDRLNSMPELADRVKLRMKYRKEADARADEEWKSKYSKPQEYDQLR